MDEQSTNPQRTPENDGRQIMPILVIVAVIVIAIVAYIVMHMR